MRLDDYMILQGFWYVEGYGWYREGSGFIPQKAVSHKIRCWAWQIAKLGSIKVREELTLLREDEHFKTNLNTLRKVGILK